MITKLEKIEEGFSSAMKSYIFEDDVAAAMDVNKYIDGTAPETRPVVRGAHGLINEEDDIDDNEKSVFLDDYEESMLIKDINKALNTNYMTEGAFLDKVKNIWDRFVKWIKGMVDKICSFFKRKTDNIKTPDKGSEKIQVLLFNNENTTKFAEAVSDIIEAIKKIPKYVLAVEKEITKEDIEDKYKLNNFIDFLESITTRKIQAENMELIYYLPM